MTPARTPSTPSSRSRRTSSRSCPDGAPAKARGRAPAMYRPQPITRLRPVRRARSRRARGLRPISGRVRSTTVRPPAAAKGASSAAARLGSSRTRLSRNANGFAQTAAIVVGADRRVGDWIATVEPGPQVNQQVLVEQRRAERARCDRAQHGLHGSHRRSVSGLRGRRGGPGAGPGSAAQRRSGAASAQSLPPGGRSIGQGAARRTFPSPRGTNDAGTARQRRPAADDTFRPSRDPNVTSPAPQGRWASAPRWHRGRRRRPGPARSPRLSVGGAA